jgi:hypothetical protein
MPTGSEVELREVIKASSDLMTFGALGELAVALNNLLTPDQPDPILRGLNRINDRLNSIEDAVLAAWVTAREDNLASIRAHSAASLITAHAFLQSGASNTSPEWAAKRALAERDSLVAVQTLVGDLEGGLWLRPFSVKAISQRGDPNSFYDGWLQHMSDRPEPHGFNRVWDYRWGLPALIYAVNTRIIVLKAFGTAAGVVRGELAGYNNFVARVFRKMESGVRHLRDLTPVQVNRIPTHGVPVAAADIYGGYFIGGMFDAFFKPSEFLGRGYPFPPPSPLLPGYQLDRVVHNMREVGGFWSDIVKREIGLPELLWYAGRLENMLAQ